MNVLDRIRKILSEKDMSISELERLSDIARGTVGKWDKVIPSADKLQRVAQTLGTSMDYLLTGKEPSEDSETLLLARDANSLTKEQLQVVKNVIDEFKKTNDIGWCDWIGKAKIIYTIK